MRQSVQQENSVKTALAIVVVRMAVRVTRCTAPVTVHGVTKVISVSHSVLRESLAMTAIRHVYAKMELLAIRLTVRVPALPVGLVHFAIVRVPAARGVSSVLILATTVAKDRVIP